MVLAYADVKDAAEFLWGSAEPSEDSNLLEKKEDEEKRRPVRLCMVNMLNGKEHVVKRM